MTPSVASSRPRLVPFFALTFAISWGVWSLAVFDGAGLVANPLSPTATRLLGAFGPSTAAILVAATEGRRALGDLLGRFRTWRVPLRWYGVVLLFPALGSLLATAVSVLLGSPVPDFANPPVGEIYPIPPGMGDVGVWALLPVVFVQTLLLSSPMGEEIGWRGYALPGLQADRSALGASLVLGVIWGVWHLPLFFLPGDPLQGGPLVPFFFGIVADTILFTWVFDNTDGSLLLVLFFHASISVTGLFLSSADAFPFLEPAVTWVIALVVLATFGTETLAGDDDR